MKSSLPRLHFVSQGQTPAEHLYHIERLARAGCPWIQLRLKDVSTEVYHNTAQMALQHCRRYGALLTINDRPDIAAAVGADGVHVGTTDIPPQEAREQLPEGIIGATANTEADLQQAVEGGVDYIGLGPFRFTVTKKKLSPVLGISGYNQRLAWMKKQGWETPVLAIGGLLEADVLGLKQTGIWGIAVSGLLIRSVAPDAVCQRLMKLLEG